MKNGGNSKMNCDEICGLLDALVDDELTAKEQASVRAHLAGCPDCAHELEQIEALRRMLKGLPRHPVPSSLTAKINSQLDEHEARPALPRRRRWILPVLSHMAAAVVGGVVLYGTVGLERGAAPLPDAIVAAHVRALGASRLVQIVSGDSHTVGPWFAGKLDYAPPVHDLAGAGFALLGGRIDTLDGHKVAALVYRRRAHRINLFIVPRTPGAPAPAARRTRRGFHIISHQDSQFTYRAISDLAENELATFMDKLAAMVR